MRAIFDLLVKIKEFIGLVLNLPTFLLWRIKFESFPRIRGRVYIRNYGSIRIGKNVYINSNLESSQLGYYPKTIFHTSQSGHIRIEDNVGLSNVVLYSRESIVIHKNARLGAGVKVYDNDFHELGRGLIRGREEIIPCSEVSIGEGAFIGAGSLVLKGVHVGKYSIVGAGSTVTKSIPDYEVWAGNPARYIRRLERVSDESSSL